MTELDQQSQQDVDSRIAELEAEVARLQSIEHGLERAAAHAQRVAARLQSILNTTIDAVITIDDHGVIQTVNPATESMFGYGAGELIGQNVRSLMPEPDQTRHDSYLGAYAQGGAAKIIGIGRTTNAMRKDGTLFPIDLSISEAKVEGHPVFTGIIRDVTDRVDAQQRVSDSEERAALVFQNAPVGLFVSSTERSISQANPALARMLGRTEEEIIGHRLSDFGAPGFTQPGNTRDYLEQNPGRDHIASSERALQRGNGSIMWAKVTVSAIRGSSGELLYVLRMVEDITAQHEAHENLLTSEARFRSMFEAAPIGIAVSSMDRQVVESNPALCRLLGRAEDEVIGGRLTRFRHPNEEQEAVSSHERLASGAERSTSFTRVLQHADGSPVWVHVTASTITGPDGVPVGIVRLVEDTTAEHHAEVERRAQEYLLRTLVDNAPLGIALVDPSRNIIKVNPAVESMFARPASEIEGHRMLDFLEVPEESNGLRDRFASGDIDYDQRERIFQKGDGTTLVAQVTNSVVRNADGSIQYFVRMFEDITQRRATEADLLGSEAQFRALFEAAPIGLVIKGVGNRTGASNSRAQEIFGKTGDELRGTRLREMWAPGFTPDASGRYVEMVAGDISGFEFEGKFVHSSGRPFWGKGNQTAVRDAEGNFLYSIQSFQDITDAKVGEQTLRASEDRFRRLFESSPLGIAVYDADRNIESVNPAFSRMIGRTEQELIGHRLSDYGADGFRAAGSSSADKIQAGESPPLSNERHLRRADGTSLWAKVSATAFHEYENGRVGIMRTMEDITDEKVAADQLLASEARFRSLFDSTPVGIALVGDDATITTVNPALERLLGYTREEIVGRTLSRFRSPDDPGTGLHRTTKLATDKLSEISTERLHLRKDGSTVWSQVVTAPVFGEQGEFLFGVRMVVDISERKEIERMKDEFLGMVSHELRTPLTAIEAGVGLVASGALGPLPEKIQRMLDIAAQNSDRLTRLVNDVLDLERMNAGRIELQPIECHASVLIEQAAHAVGALAMGAGVTIETTSTDAVFVADPDRVVQALINLAANAVKFSPSGTAVCVGVTKTDAGIRFSISDHGRGIPQAEIPLIFDRFHQVQRGDSRNQGGTGLGLAICQWIVEQHRGRIWVESAVEQGSTFFFELPQRW